MKGVGKKRRTVPAKYSVGWLKGVDRRYRPAVLARTYRDALVDALGGDVSPQQSMLLERAVWLHLRLQQMEQEFLTTGKLVNNEYTQLSNSLLGVLKAIGLGRKAKRVKGLQEVLAEAAAEGDAQ